MGLKCSATRFKSFVDTYTEGAALFFLQNLDTKSIDKAGFERLSASMNLGQMNKCNFDIFLSKQLTSWVQLVFENSAPWLNSSFLCVYNSFYFSTFKQVIKIGTSSTWLCTSWSIIIFHLYLWNSNQHTEQRLVKSVPVGAQYVASDKYREYK